MADCLTICQLTNGMLLSNDFLKMIVNCETGIVYAIPIFVVFKDCCVSCTNNILKCPYTGTHTVLVYIRNKRQVTKDFKWMLLSLSNNVKCDKNCICKCMCRI